jgi:TP901 family phage tail tape measure protein
MPQFIGTAYVDLKFDTAKATAGVTSTMGAAGAAGATAMTSNISSKLLAFGTQATRLGRQMSFGISAPLGAIGRAADQAFLAFDTNMTKVFALTGAGTENTQQLSQTVLDLASQYGVAGEEAANAFYLISSSGIKGQAAIDTLETSLKASAVGMGDAATIAGLLTSAINAYGESTLPAAKAADILTGAVKESKIPADELAGSISNLLPFGSQLHVGFDQITGAMAALSLQGTNAAMAATQLRGIFNGLLDPSAQAAKAFDRLGLNANQLRATLSDKGIVPAIQQIRDAIVKNGGESDTELAEIFGNVRALTGVFGLLNDTGGKVQRVFKNTTDSANALNKAWAVTADTAGFKAKQATQALHNEMIALGSDVAPITTGLLGIARSFVAVFNSLGPLRPAIVAVGAAFVALGPIAYSIGGIADAIGIATGVYAKLTATSAVANAEMTAGSTAAAAAQTTEAAAIEATVVAVEQLTLSEEAATVATQGRMFSEEAMVGIQAEAIAGTEAEAAALAAETAAAGTASGALATFGAIASAALAPIAAIVLGAAAAFVIWNKRMDNAREDADALGDVFANKIAGGGVNDALTTIGKTEEQIKGLNDEIANSKAPWDKDYRDELGMTVEELQKHIDASRADIAMSKELATQTKGNSDEIFNWLSNERNAGRTYENSEKALEAYTKEVAKHGGVVSTAATATGQLVDKAKELASAFFASTSAEKSYADSIKKIHDAEQGVVDAQKAVTDAHRGETDAQQKVVDAQQKAADATRKITDAQDKYRDALTKVGDAQRELADAQQRLNDLAKGPSQSEQLDIRSSQLALKRAQQRMREKFDDPLDREQAAIDLQRAQLDLARVKGEHGENVTKAQEDVTKAQKGVVDAQKDAADAQRGISDAQRDAVEAARGITDAQNAVRDAHDKVTEAEKNVKVAQDNVAQAQLDAAGAADGLAQKQEELNQKIQNSNGQLGPLIDYLLHLKDLYPEAAGGLDVFIQKAQAAEDAFRKAAAAARDQPIVAPNIEGTGKERALAGRASGGPLSAGQGSLVNERGLPELWTADGKQYLLPVRAGNVVPLKPVTMPVAGGDQPSVQVGDIHVYGQTQPVATAYEVRRQMRAKPRMVARRG